LALETAKDDVKLAQRQGNIARNICLKYNIRLPYEKRQLFCRGCKKLIIPGINSKIRIGGRSNKAIRITCLECGNIYRKIIRNKKIMNIN
tara:strand:- start:175 stop:444 length:270 start_codon:yes stop_codon:yes gene_type:complete